MDFSEYKGIYVIAEVEGGRVTPVTEELLGEARRLSTETGDPVCTVLMGSGIRNQAESLIAHGADIVYVMDSPLLSHYDGKAYEKALAALLKEKKPSAVLFAATPYGRDLAPRTAANVVCGVTADVTELSVDKETGLFVWSRPAMDGNIMADIVSPLYRPQVGTVRPGTFAPLEADSSWKGEVVDVPVQLAPSDLGTLLKEIIPAPKEENPVEKANLVVAGGRGFRTQEEWKLLYELADILGGSVGATRPICELGWEPHSRQIGQTGKSISPHVYFAFGISGAMQHICGVKADIMIAVNRDPNAPIMEIADYAVCADLKEFLPALINEIKALRKK